MAQFPSMQPMQIPQMQATDPIKQGLAALQMAQGARNSPQPGLLQQFLNPPAPLNLAAPGMPPNGSPQAGGMATPGQPPQAGLLAKLFPALNAGAASPGAAPQTMPTLPPNILGSGPY